MDANTKNFEVELMAQEQTEEKVPLRARLELVKAL